jgi:hypothetical protein
MVPEIEDTAALASIATNLIERGTAFIAIPKDPLENGCLHLCSFALGDELNRYARKLEDVEHATFDDKKFEFLGISNVLHPEVHFENRIPLYAVENPSFGLTEIPLEEGFTNLNEFLSGEFDIPQPEETVPLKTLIEELIEGGAVAVGLQKTLFEMNDTTLPLRVHMPPVIGRRIAGQYEAVTIENETHSHEIEAVLDGPGFSGQVPIYASETILGMEPVPVEEGIQNLQTYLTETSEA